MPRYRLTFASAVLLLALCAGVVQALETATVRRLYGREIYTIEAKTLDDQYFIDLDNQVRAYFPGIDSLKIPYVVATNLKATSGGTLNVISNLSTQRKTTLGDSTGDTVIVFAGRSAFGRSGVYELWAPGSVEFIPETTIDIGKYSAITEDSAGVLNVGQNYRVGRLPVTGTYAYRSRKAGGMSFLNMYNTATSSSILLRAGKTTTDSGAFSEKASLSIAGSGTVPAATFTSARTTSVVNAHPGIIDGVHSSASKDTTYMLMRMYIGSEWVYRLTADGTVWERGAYIGNWNSRTNYARIDTTGHLTWAGEGRPWRDVDMDALSIKTSPSAKIAENSTTVTMDYAADCSNSDWTYGNLQLNHDRDLASPVWPHIHWLQAQSGTPNFFIAYRWHQLLRAYDATWDTLNVTKLAKAYYTGTIHQLSYCDSIPPPDSTNVSDILQFKIVRDRTNATGRFAGSTDPTSVLIPVLSIDAHYMSNSFGSDTQYTK